MMPLTIRVCAIWSIINYLSFNAFRYSPGIRNSHYFRPLSLSDNVDNGYNVKNTEPESPVDILDNIISSVTSSIADTTVSPAKIEIPDTIDLLDSIINDEPISTNAADIVTATTNLDALLTNTIAPPVVIPPKDLKMLSLDPPMPEGTSYIMCSSCKAAFLMDESKLAKRSVRVRCSVCQKEWFQTSERLLRLDNLHHIQNMTEDKVQEVRRTLNENRWSRSKGISIFVGNLPYTYDETAIGDLFGEYGTKSEYLTNNMCFLSPQFNFFILFLFCSFSFTFPFWCF